MLQGTSPSAGMPARQVDVVEFVDKLFQDRKVDGVSLRDCFMAAATMDEFLRLFHDRIAVQASLHLPEVVEKLARRAKQGDIESAKLLCEVSGVVMRGRKAAQNVQAVQINITSEEQARLERALAGEFDAGERA